MRQRIFKDSIRLWAEVFTLDSVARWTLDWGSEYSAAKVLGWWSGKRKSSDGSWKFSCRSDQQRGSTPTGRDILGERNKKSSLCTQRWRARTGCDVFKWYPDIRAVWEYLGSCMRENFLGFCACVFHWHTDSNERPVLLWGCVRYQRRNLYQCESCWWLD